jgi:hypothetical protein
MSVLSDSVIQIYSLGFKSNIVQRIKRWKPMSKRPTGRPKTRREDDVLKDINKMNVGNWKKVAQKRDSWKKVVEQARALYCL